MFRPTLFLKPLLLTVPLALAWTSPLGALDTALNATVTTARYDHEWPQWRGPLGTGVAPHGDPPVTWSESENLRWKVEVPGRGHASPIVWADRVYVLSAVEIELAAASSASPESEGQEAGSDGARRGIQPSNPVSFKVFAIDRTSGEVVWERIARTAVPHEGTHMTATWASSSAVTDGEVLIANFGSNGLYAYDLDGRLVWERDLGDQQTRNGFGEGSSPAIFGSTVIVNWDHEGDSFIVALDRSTGETRWRRDRDEPTSWSTPLVIEVDGRAQVVVNATNRVRAYDLETGEIVWHVGGMTTNAIPTPSYADGVVYVMSGFRGSMLLAIRVAGARGDLDGTEHVAWSHERDTSYTPSGLVYGDTYYFVKSNTGILSGVDSKTGELLFGPERLEGIDGDGGIYASPVGAANRVYIAGQNGVTLVLERGPRLEILASNQLDDGFDASPAVVGDALFLRGRKYLYCLGRTADSEAPVSGVEVGSGAGLQPPIDEIESVAWMAGCWIGDGGEECWLAPLGGTMMGINRGPEREGKQPAFEFLRIVEQGGGLAFLASPGGQAPVAFPAIEVAESKIVFANTEHDFPQRLTYRLEDGDTLKARVEAQTDGKWGGFDVTWKRTSWRTE